MRAMVLSGGGSRGAYQIGAWQALAELGTRLDGVYGTSIGALNAALVAQGDLDGALELWHNITLNQVMTVADDDDFAIERMVSRKRDVIPFLMENREHLRMDIGPLEKLVRERVDEGRVRASGLKLGVMVCRASQLAPEPVRLETLPPGQMADWIIASASCFPIFPVKRIGGHSYIDGGYCDNLPLDMALADGMDELIAVELHPGHTHPEYARMPWLTTISPTRELGGFLDFNPELLRRSRMLGYCDAMKRFGRFDGFLYTFRQVGALRVADAARRTMRAVTAFDAGHIRRGLIYAGQSVKPPLQQALEADTGGARLSWKGVWLRGLELCAREMRFREDAVYDADALLRRVRDYCDAQSFDDPFDDEGLEATRRQGSRRLLAFIYQQLCREGVLPTDCLRRLATLPGPTAAALFLYSATRP